MKTTSSHEELDRRSSLPIVQLETQTWDPEAEKCGNPPSSMQQLQAPSEGSRLSSITNVPAEIWSKIFGVATYIPGAYDITDYAATAAFAHDTHGICINNRFKAAMRIKLDCGLVCKYFNAIIQPFIFEYIRIRSGDQVCAIADALTRIPQDVDERGGPGKWTVRIDLALEGVHSWSSTQDEAMFRIIGYCHNLVCLSTVFSSGTFPATPKKYGLPTEVIRYLRPGQNPNLKRLEIKSDDKDVLPNIEAVLGDSLEVLWIVTSWPASQEREMRCRFPKVRTFIATSGGGALSSQLLLPHLRACVVDKNILSISSIADTSLIEYVSLLDSKAIVRGFEAWPNLVTLSMKVDDLMAIDITENFQLTRLECIMIKGIETLNRHQLLAREFSFSNHVVSRIHENLTLISSRYSCPNLGWAKFFLSLPKSQYVAASWSNEDGRKRFWNDWINSCNDRGIRLEVSIGETEWSGNQWTELRNEEMMNIL